MMTATKKTNLRTADGLTVYDLDPQAADLWAVAGPDGLDPATIDTDNLPDGCRWVDNGEWEWLNAGSPTYWQAELYRGGELYDAGYPKRQTREEAEEDARTALADLSDRERQRATACVAEWQTDDGGETARSTGRCADVTI
jgi:hypothetical protein